MPRLGVPLSLECCCLSWHFLLKQKYFENYFFPHLVYCHFFFSWCDKKKMSLSYKKTMNMFGTFLFFVSNIYLIMTTIMEYSELICNVSSPFLANAFLYAILWLLIIDRGWCPREQRNSVWKLCEITVFELRNCMEMQLGF